MGPFQNNTQLKALVFNIDFFQINYTILAKVKSEQGNVITVKWEIDQNFDVSTDNICVVTLDMKR